MRIAKAADQGQVEDDRGRSKGREPTHAVEQAAEQCRDRNQQQVWEGDTGQINGRLKLLWLIDKAGGQYRYQCWHEQQAEQDEGDQEGNHDRHGAFCHGFPGFFSLDLDLFRDHGHEGGAERTLGKQAAEEIGQFQRDEKGIGHGSSPEDHCRQQVTGKAENPAEHGQAANSGNGTRQ